MLCNAMLCNAMQVNTEIDIKGSKQQNADIHNNNLILTYEKLFY